MESVDNEDLIQALDPARDYGERSYEQVVEGVRTGVLKLEAGLTVPVLKDAQTNLVVKGTGRPPGKGAHAAFSRAYIQEKFEGLMSGHGVWIVVREALQRRGVVFP